MNIIDFFKTTICLTAAIALSASLSSCSSDNDDNPLTQYRQVIFNIENSELTFDSDGLWTEASQSTPGNMLNINGMSYSRMLNPARETMYGFQPSRSTLTQVVAGSDKSGLEYGAMGYKANATQKNYLVACWDVNETTNGRPSQPSCRMKLTNGSKLIPQGIYISSNALTHETMKARNAQYSLVIYGVKNNVLSGPVRVTMGEPNQYGYDAIVKWAYVDLEGIGEVDYIYFQMEASVDIKDVPPYFCLLQSDVIYAGN